MMPETERSIGYKPNYADLFAGCGGLSLGLEWAGFSRSASIEISPDAALTYYHNLICREELSSIKWTDFLESKVLQSSLGLIVGNIAERLGDFLLSCNNRSTRLDLLVGGPPCQGFSVAGKRDPADPRNNLANYFVEAIRLLQPRMILMENVPAINYPNKINRNGNTALESIKKGLESQKYKISVFRLEASEVGVPQKRTRLFVLGVQDQYFKLMPRKDQRIWQMENGAAKLIRQVGRAPTVEEALADIGTNGYTINLPSDYGKLNYARSLRFSQKFTVPAATQSGGKIRRRILLNHELRRHRPNTIARFKYYLYLKDLGLDGRLLHLASIVGKDYLKHQIYSQLSKNGSSPTEIESLVSALTDSIIKYQTKKHTQIVLTADLPAKTITTLPDDLIHFSEPRVLSVRELARLQSFPDSFIFKGKTTTGGTKRRTETPQYSQVGNAVPPIMAREVGRLVKRILKYFPPNT